MVRNIDLNAVNCAVYRRRQAGILAENVEISLLSSLLAGKCSQRAVCSRLPTPPLFSCHPHLNRDIDESPVLANRLRKQISAEDTLPEDITLGECEMHMRLLAEKVWDASKSNARYAKTVILKLETKEFQSLTRSLTFDAPIPSCEALLLPGIEPKPSRAPCTKSAGSL